MYAYIVLSLLVGLRTEEARALRWDHVDLDGDPDASPPCRRTWPYGAPSAFTARLRPSAHAARSAYRLRSRRRLDAPRTPDLLRQPDEPSRRKH